MTQDDAIRAFHRQRWMFAVIDGRPVFAKRGVPWSHARWLRRYGVTGPQLRGYYDESGLYFYSTEDCEAVAGDWEKVLAVLPALAYVFDMGREDEIHAGTVPGQPGERWKPYRTVGRVGDFVTVQDMLNHEVWV